MMMMMMMTHLNVKPHVCWDAVVIVSLRCVSAATFLLLFFLSFFPAGDQACCSADFTAYKSTTVTSIDAILYQPYSLGFTLFYPC